MSDELLRLYNSELQFIRRQGDDFARAHPEVASHLKIGSEGENDPYVGRLVEAFAYLNARTRLKLEDEFPEIAGSLVDVVLPHYQRPIPSMSIAQFVLDRGQAELFGGYPIPVGSSLETQPIDGEPCTFRTCYPTTCWPLEIKSIQLRGVPFEAPQAILPKPALGLLKISLGSLDGKAPIAQFKTKSLRFFIKLAAPFCYQFYEMIFDSVLGVSLAASAKDPAAQQLRGSSLHPTAITPVGFAEDEGLVDYPPQSFIGYRLLSEYFAFPEKFLFFDVQLGDALAQQQGTQFELFFYLNRRWQELEPHIQPDTLQLGCTPIINLFPKRAEPIRLTHFTSSYPVIADARRPHAHEVYAIEEVTAISAAGETRDIQPFYSFRHAEYKLNRAFLHASRRVVESNNELAR